MLLTSRGRQLLTQRTWLLQQLFLIKTHYLSSGNACTCSFCPLNYLLYTYFNAHLLARIYGSLGNPFLSNDCAAFKLFVQFELNCYWKGYAVFVLEKLGNEKGIECYYSMMSTAMDWPTPLHFVTFMFEWVWTWCEYLELLCMQKRAPTYSYCIIKHNGMYFTADIKVQVQYFLSVVACLYI